jgi:hypothetical protein
MYRPKDNRWQHRHKRYFPTTFQMLSQLGNISRVSSGMTSKNVACVLVSHFKWKTSLSLYLAVDTETTNAALTPAAVSKSISKTE